MGTLRKAVVLSEGAKPGIPAIKVEKLDHGSVEMTIMVILWLARELKSSVAPVLVQSHTECLRATWHLGRVLRSYS